MTNAQYDRQEVVAFRRELSFRNEGTLKDKGDCINKMLAEIAENPEKFRYNLFLLLHGDYGHGAKLMANAWTDRKKLTNLVKLFVLVAQTAYMTGDTLAYLAWKDRLSLKAKEEMLDLIGAECDRYNEAWKAGQPYEWIGENHE